MTDNKALEQKLCRLTVELVNLLQCVLDVFSFTQGSAEADLSEDELILGQRSGFVAENVVDVAELLWELHALNAARNNLATLSVQFHNVSVARDVLGHDEFSNFQIENQIQRHESHTDQEERKEPETHDSRFVCFVDAILGQVRRSASYRRTQILGLLLAYHLLSTRRRKKVEKTKRKRAKIQ